MEKMNVIFNQFEWKKDYKENPDKIIEECISFLKN